jgi:hypothetical protein
MEFCRNICRNLFRLIRLLPWGEADKAETLDTFLPGSADLTPGENSPLFELASVLVRLDHVACFIVKRNHSAMGAAVKLCMAILLPSASEGTRWQYIGDCCCDCGFNR